MPRKTNHKWEIKDADYIPPIMHPVIPEVLELVKEMKESHNGRIVTLDPPVLKNEKQMVAWRATVRHRFNRAKERLSNIGICTKVIVRAGVPYLIKISGDLNE